MDIRRTLFMLFLVIVPHLLFGQKDIKFDEIWGVEIRYPHYSIPIEAYVEEENHNLTIVFLDNCNPLYIEIKDSEGCVLYRTALTPVAKESHVILLEQFSSGKYKLVINDGNVSMVGTFFL